MGADQHVQDWAIVWQTAAIEGNVYVDDVQFDPISYEYETLVVNDNIAWEEMVCGQLCVDDGVVNEADKTSSCQGGLGSQWYSWRCQSMVRQMTACSPAGGHLCDFVLNEVGKLCAAAHHTIAIYKRIEDNTNILAYTAYIYKRTKTFGHYTCPSSVGFRNKTH